MKVEHQIAIIFCGVEDLLERIPIKDLHAFEKEYIECLELAHPDVLSQLKAGNLTDEIKAILKDVVNELSLKYSDD